VLRSFFACVCLNAARAQPIATSTAARRSSLQLGRRWRAATISRRGRSRTHEPPHPGQSQDHRSHMPGATGLIATNYLYNVAKRDGTVIGMPTSNVPLEPRLKLTSTDGSAVKFRSRAFSWIGTTLQSRRSHGSGHRSRKKRQRPQDQYDRDGPTAIRRQLCPALLANVLIGTRMRSSPAMSGRTRSTSRSRRGEVQGNNTGLSNLTAAGRTGARPQGRILLQYGNQTAGGAQGCADGRRIDGVGCRPRDAALYALKFTMTRPLMIRRRASGACEGVAGRLSEATMKDPSLPRRGAPDRPRYNFGSAARRSPAGAADPGDTAVDRRSAAGC